MADSLRPMRGSVVRVSERARAYNMERMAISAHHREFIERLSLSIFTDMVNSGQTFQAALSAIYLSGIKHGSEAEKGNNDER